MGCSGMWIELHDSAREHPKVLKLAKRLGITRVQALGHVISLWCWTLRMAADGDLRSFDSEDLELAADWDGTAGHFVEAALAVRLLDKGRYGFIVHDWDDYSGSLKAAQRTREWRKRKEDRGDDPPNPDRKRHGDVTVTSGDADRPTDRPTRPTDQTDLIARSARAHSVPAALSPVAVSIPLVSGEEFPLTEADTLEWASAFPAVDVPQCLRSIRQWCLANPQRRKTAKGVRRFVVSWLTREQDSGKRPPVNGQVPLTRKGQEMALALNAGGPDTFREFSRAKA